MILTAGKQFFACIFACLLMIAGFVPQLYGQQVEQVEIINANTFEGDESLGKNVARLTGDVQFRHKGAMMYCDSAYLYQDANSLDAFGRIKIEQGDSIRLTGDFLKYDGNTRSARVVGNVVLVDRTMTLTTHEVVYSLSNRVAKYETPGVITDKENKLTSNSGYYLTGEKMVFFKDDVVLTNPEYRMESDTLKYNTVSRTAWFYGPTTITSTGTDSTFMYCESGWYDTNRNKSSFKKNAFIRSGESSLSGDSLFFNRNTLVGEAYGNVQLSDTVNQVIVSGDFGRSDDKKKKAFVTGKATLIKMFTADSLFLHADTLFAAEDTAAKVRTWTARRNVRFFKPDLQGKCDTLTYSTSDSMVVMKGVPVLWTDSSQMTAEWVTFQIANQEVSRLYLHQTAFIISKEDSVRFNQVKGRTMTGYFTENKLSSILVEGNGQSVYYTRNSKKQLTGVNRADCSDMLILFEENRVSGITLINQPDATLYPIQELQANELILKDFGWSETARPKDRQAIYERH